MGLLLIIVLGRTLGDAGSGVVLQAIGAFSIALGVARFGMDSASVWILPRLLEDGRGHIRSTTIFLLTASAVVGGVCALVVFIGTLLIDEADPGDPVAEALRAIIWFLPVASVLLTALSATRGLGGVTAYVMIGNIGLPTMRPLFALLAIGLSSGVAAVSAAWALPLIPAVLAALIIVGFQVRQVAARREPEYLRSGIPGRTLRYALPRVVSSTLEQLLIWLAVIIVGAIAGPAAAGIYGAASRFVASGMIVDTALRVVVSPLFSRLQHRGDIRELEQVYRTATIWLMLFSTPVYLLLAVFSPVALSLLGGSFAEGEPVMVVMCLGAVVTFLAGNIHSVLLMSGRGGLAAMNKALAVATNIALLYVLVPFWGVTGAAVAWAVACLLDAVLATVQVRLLLRIRVSPIAGLRPLAIGVLGVGIPAILARLVFGATWLGLLVSAAIGLALLATWCLRDRERLHLDGLHATPSLPVDQRSQSHAR